MSLLTVFVFAFAFCLVACECPAGQTSFILVRMTSSYASEESLNLYLGSDTSANPVYTESVYSLASSTTYSSTRCLSYGAYTAVMGDSYGDGWSSGSRLEIMFAGSILATVQWTCATTSTQSCTSTFTLAEPPSWQYTSTPQTGSDWKTGAIDWPSASSDFPAPTTTTRYFRYSLAYEDDQIGILVSLQTDAGAVVYVNGMELVRWNMPEGTVTSDTGAGEEAAPGNHSRGGR